MNIEEFAKSYFVWIFTVLLLGLLMMPAIRFLVVGWADRRRDVLSSFTSDAIKKYFKQFYPTETLDENTLSKKFEDHYEKKFGRRHYTFPLIFFVVIIGLLLFLLGGTVSIWLKISSETYEALPPIASAAFAGAYMWVLGDLISRNRRSDLPPSVLSWGVFRFVISVPFAYAFARLFNDSLAVPIAFLIGVFPTRTLFKMAQRIVIQKMKLGEAGEEGINELERLQCINTSNAEVFANEGITTILDLAYSDPVALTIRTSFNFNYVVDCISQALAWIYFEDNLANMRIYSLRGAQEIASLVAEIDDDSDTDAQGRARQALNEIAFKNSMQAPVLERTFREIADDPFTCFLCEIWAETESLYKNSCK